LGLCRG